MDEVRTTHLGQFTDVHAEEIARRLEDAGIVWWRKRAGWISQTLFADQWGVRLFVDESRLEEAQAIAADILRPDPTPEAPPGG